LIAYNEVMFGLVAMLVIMSVITPSVIT
jgi:hypothetical protein